MELDCKASGNNSCHNASSGFRQQYFACIVIAKQAMRGTALQDIRQQTHCLAKVDVELAHDHSKDVTAKALLVQVAKGLTQPAGIT